MVTRQRSPARHELFWADATMTIPEEVAGLFCIAKTLRCIYADAAPLMCSITDWIELRCVDASLLHDSRSSLFFCFPVNFPAELQHIQRIQTEVFNQRIAHLDIAVRKTRFYFLKQFNDGVKHVDT